jgi:hypothetical protein
MDDRLKSHTKTFDRIDWESMPEGKYVHSYAETIVAETSTLHNVLKRYLSPMVIEVFLLFVVYKDDHGRSVCELYISFDG